MRITLVRHATTPWNEQARYQGWTDTPLSASGIQEAQALHQRFITNDVTAVISSDLSRCMDTARIVFPNHLIRSTPELREISFGAWEGLTYQECLNRDESLYRPWIDDPATTTPPGGEPLPTFQSRIQQMLSAIRSEYEQDHETATRTHLAIVTHGGPIRLLLRSLLTSDSIPGESRTPSYHDTDVPHPSPCGCIHLQLSPDRRQYLLTPLENHP